MVNIIPMSHGFTPNVSFIDDDIELACVRLPIPKDAITANKANRKPRSFPTDLFLNAFRMVYIGPPDISPFWFTSRYLIASIHSLNLLVIPKQADIHIQTSAPGPPDTIAVATPTILPVPMVAARAVVSAENGDTSPSPRFFVRASLLSVLFIAYPRFRHVRKRVLIVRKIPVPTRRISITGPQTKVSTAETMLSKVFILNYLPSVNYVK